LIFGVPDPGNGYTLHRNQRSWAPRKLKRNGDVGVRLRNTFVVNNIAFGLVTLHDWRTSRGALQIQDRRLTFTDVH